MTDDEFLIDTIGTAVCAYDTDLGDEERFLIIAIDLVGGVTWTHRHTRRAARELARRWDAQSFLGIRVVDLATGRCAA